MSESNTENPTRYRLERVEDFEKIPEEKLGKCLEEFRTWIEVYRSAKVFVESLGDETCKGSVKSAAFVWIDDGKEDVNISINQV